MAIRLDHRKTCKHCSAPMQARMVPSVTIDIAGSATAIFGKSLPVLICPSCDTAPRKRKDTLHPPS